MGKRCADLRDGKGYCVLSRDGRELMFLSEVNVRRRRLFIEGNQDAHILFNSRQFSFTEVGDDRYTDGDDEGRKTP